MDSDYVNLLLHLQKSPKELHPAVFSSLVQQLNNLPVPFSTTLTASVIASPAWDESNLTSLLFAFRQATHFKAEQILKSSTTGISLAPSASWKFRGWIGSICSGARTGSSKARIAVLGGLIIGSEELKERLNVGGAHAKVENELVVAVADYLSSTELTDHWSSDFRDIRDHRHTSDIVLVLVSESLPLVQDRKLRLIDLPRLVSLCLDRISRYFDAGHVLSVQRSLKDDPRDSSSRLPRIARLTSKAISALSDNPGSKINELTDCLEASIDLFGSMAVTLEGDWIASETNRSDPGITTSNEDVWTMFKTFLFTAIMVLQSAVDSLLYRNTSNLASNAKLAGRIIKCLSHLSFISIKFGGLSAQGEGSFHEYKRTFYEALDIVLASPPQGDELMQALSGHLILLQKSGLQPGDSCRLAASTFYFHCAEQLVEQLSFQTLSQHVLPVCREYLGSVQHREAFESAHSVLLALFSSQGRSPDRSDERAELVRSMVPFYVTSLIDCSADDMLNIDQLRLAFASLVSGSTSSNSDNGSLTWYSIESLLAKINHLRALQPRPEAQCNRLELALVSLLPSVSSNDDILLKLLENIEKLIVEEDQPTQRQLLLEAVRDEILHRVSDVQRETVLRWWYSMAKLQDTTGDSNKLKPSIHAGL
ncbi:hypothetical protein FS842_010198 [Serendipita sp. 407]|nr:hypothetical protein FS842_010198 [Serendipita sp. 407]